MALYRKRRHGRRLLRVRWPAVRHGQGEAPDADDADLLGAVGLCAKDNQERRIPCALSSTSNLNTILILKY